MIEEHKSNNIKLTDPKILNLFILSLKSLHKQQENKKRNYKKLKNLFSVKVQKYDDSSSHNKTDEKFKNRKCEIANKMYKRKKNFNMHTNNNKMLMNAPTKGMKKNYGNINDDIGMNYTHQNLKINYSQGMINIYNYLDLDVSEIHDREYEYNSDSSIFTKEKIIYQDMNESYTYNNESYEYNDDFYNFKNKNGKNQNALSSKPIARNLLNERSKFIKHKFSKQMDQAKSKKFIKEDVQINTNANNNTQNNNNNVVLNSKPISKLHNHNLQPINTNLNMIYAYDLSNSTKNKTKDDLISCTNLNIDTSVYNSYKSNNSTENKKLNSTNILNYYLIKSLEEDKDLIFYNDDSKEQKIKYDDNYKCYYSLDHKSRIIYIKPSPKLLSSINSLLTSQIVSKKTTNNISNEQSNKFSSLQSPKTNALNKNIPTNDDINLKMMSFDHNDIVEKLKNLELLRNDKDSKTIISSSEEEKQSDSD